MSWSAWILPLLLSIDAPDAVTTPPDSLPPDAATAYAIQQAVIAGLGQRTGAWKIGAKAPGGAASGAPIPASLVFESPARVAHGGFFRVLLELEIAFRFSEAIEPRGEAYARDEVLARVGVVLPAIEIVDSRFGEWPNIAPLAQLADAQNNGALITGHPLAYAGLARGLDFVSPRLELSFDGASWVSTQRTWLESMRSGPRLLTISTSTLRHSSVICRR